MFERSWTVVMPANAGPGVIPIPDVNLPGGDPQLELEAWTGFLQGSNVYIFEDSVSLPDAQNRITRADKMDCFMVVPRAGVGKVRVPGDMANRLTVFFDTVFASPTVVTVRLRQVA